jgi:type IV pilus assembly protein PilM
MAGFARLFEKKDYGEIGLELSLEELHMVQLCRIGEGLEVQAYTSVAYTEELQKLLSDPPAFTTLVKRGLKQADFVGSQVVVAMPASLTQVMPVSYQTSEMQSDDAAIAKLMQERIGDSIADFVIDYMPVQTLYEGRQKLALVAICREETVTNLLELMRKAGLKVNALEIGPIALRRLITLLQRTGPVQNTIVVNCGREKSYLTLLSDERLLADDEVDFGEDTVLNKICSTLDMPRDLAFELVQQISLDPAYQAPDAEMSNNADTLLQIVKPLMSNLAREIQRGLVFAQSESRGSRPNQVYLQGSIARWPGAAELLSSILETPVASAPSPLALFSSGSSRDPAQAPELAVATGLALRKYMQRG